MNKYRKKYIQENGMSEFNSFSVNDYTEFLENELEAITVTPCCQSDSELLICEECKEIVDTLEDDGCCEDCSYYVAN